MENSTEPLSWLLNSNMLAQCQYSNGNCKQVIDKLLKVVVMNFQSIAGKKSVLDNHIDCYKPDIIFDTETWQYSNISSTLSCN